MIVRSLESYGAVSSERFIISPAISEHTQYSAASGGGFWESLPGRGFVQETPLLAAVSFRPRQ